MSYLDASGGITRVSIQYAIGPEPPRGMMALVSGAASWLGRAVHGEPHRRAPLTDPYAKT